MSSQILIAMDDLETAVRLNAAFKGGEVLHRDVLQPGRRARHRAARESELVILTGAVKSRTFQQRAALAQ